MKKPNLPDIGRYPIWIKGSCKTIWRTVYVEGPRSWIVWGGQRIEVRRSNSGMGFCSVEQY